MATVAIIGSGSIGARHERNCRTLGYDVEVLSRHQGRALTRDAYDLVIVCSKTAEHRADVAKHQSRSDSWLIEKPLATSVADGLAVKKILDGKKVRVAYCFIYHPVIGEVKRLVDEQALGAIYLVQAHAGSYLPDWRAGEDYRHRYSAHRHEGGGVSLDLIHEVNYLQYLFGSDLSVAAAIQDTVSDLEITSDDLAHFVLSQPRRYLTVTLNYFQSPAERTLKLVGQHGTLAADLMTSEVTVVNRAGQVVHHRRFAFDRNQMYLDEVRSMMRFIEGQEEQRAILSLDQAIMDLRIVEGTRTHG